MPDIPDQTAVAAPRAAMPVLSLRAWWDAIGDDALARVLEAADVSPLYFRAMASLTRPCKPAMFERIEKAARALTPQFVPDYVFCTRASTRSTILQARRDAREATRAFEAKLAGGLQGATISGAVAEPEA